MAVRTPAHRRTFGRQLKALLLQQAEAHAGVYLYAVFRRDIRPTIATPPSLEHVQFRLFDEMELLHFSQNRRHDLRAEFVREACHRGDLCTGAIEHGRMLAYSFWSVLPTHHRFDVWATPAASQCYGYTGFVLPDQRGRGTYETLILPCSETLHARGGGSYIWHSRGARAMGLRFSAGSATAPHR